MHGTIKPRTDSRKAKIRTAKAKYYRAYHAELNTFIRRPEATQADKAAGNDGLPRWDRPRFDMRRFVGPVDRDNILARLDAAAPLQERRPSDWRRSPMLPDREKLKPAARGISLPATWEGGNRADPRTTRPGVSYETLLARAHRPINLFAGPTDAQTVTRDGRVFSRRHVIEHSNKAWFGDKYPGRWNQPASSYIDIRIAGKPRRVVDETWRAADETGDYLSTQPNKHVGRRCPLIFYEKPFLCIFLFWLMAGLDAPLKDFWLFASGDRRRKRHAGIAHTPGLARVISEIETTFTLETWTPKEAKKRNRAKRPKPRRPGFLTAQEELELARRGKAGDIRARDEIIARHWRLVERECRHVPVADQADAIQAGMKRLLRVWDDWDLERGVRFGAFAAEAIEWEIKDFMKQRRRQVPVAQSIIATDPVANSIDIQKAENNTMTNNEKQESIAKRKLVTGRLDCLNSIEQRVMAQRLGLNGYQPLEQVQIADQLGMSERQIRRIEKAAVGKLREAVL